MPRPRHQHASATSTARARSGSWPGPSFSSPRRSVASRHQRERASATSSSASPIRSTCSAGLRLLCPAAPPRTGFLRRSRSSASLVATTSSSPPDGSWSPSFEGRPNEGRCRNQGGLRMSLLRLALIPLAALALVAPTQAATTVLKTPTNVHGFLADKQSGDPTFSRTPSFAWNAVHGAAKYEFALSTSPLFSGSGLIWDDSTLTTPVAAVPIALPWITGNPHSLYARVRALGSNGSVGPSGSSFISNVYWRIRAVRRVDFTPTNKLPTVSYGPWSPVYTSANSPFQTGLFANLSTLAEPAVPGHDPAHDGYQLMPAFLVTGNTGFLTPVELWRVYAFSDEDCVNQVF